MNNSNGNAPRFRGAFISDAIDEVTRYRQELIRTQEWIVDKIFPAGAMHLIGGPSGVGKTTWLLQMLHEWEQGLKLFGEYQSHPVPWVYISNDRAMRETTLTLERLGYSDWEFEAHALEELIYDKATGKCKSPDFAVDILKRFPYAQLVVIEGLQAVMPDTSKTRSQNKQELLWALEQRYILAESNRTIIATTHNPKINQAGAATNDERSKFLGSQGFIGSCSTMIGFEKSTTDENKRNVTVMGRNFKDMRMLYSLDDNGRFVLEANQSVPVVTEGDSEFQFLIWLSAKTPVLAKGAQDYFESLELGGRSKFYEFMNRLKSEGKITSAATSVNGKKATLYTYQPQLVQ